MGFTLLGIRIRIAPTFLLFQVGLAVFVSLTLPTSASLKVAAFLLISVVVFVSVLVHEMGHALAARRAGAGAEITLVWFGGYTRYVANVSARRRLWISAAGVVYQVAMAAVVWLLIQQGLFADTFVPRRIAEAFVFFNLFMAGVNLIPVGGMDGGAILGSLLEMLRVPRPKLVLLVIYGVGGVGITMWALANGRWFFVAAGLYLTYSGIRGQVPHVLYEQDARANPQIEARVRRLQLTRQHAAAAQEAHTVLAGSDSSPYRVYATSVVLDGLRLAGQAHELREALVELDLTGIAPLTLTQAYRAADHPNRAIEVLLPAFADGRDPLIGLELAHAYVAAGLPGDATGLFVGDRSPLPPLLGIEVHSELVDGGALDAARAVRESVGAHREVPLGVTAHMMVREGFADQGLAILERDHESSANRATASWLEYGLSLTGRHQRAVIVRSQEVPGRLGSTDALSLTYLFVNLGAHQQAVDVGLSALDAPPDALTDLLSYHVAGALDQVGRLDEALDLLSQIASVALMQMILDDDLLENVRSTDRFLDLVERLATSKP